METIHYLHVRDKTGRPGVFIPLDDWRLIEERYHTQKLTDGPAVEVEDNKTAAIQYAAAVNDRLLNNEQNLRRNKLLSGHPWMINDAGLPEGQFYYEWPNGQITIHGLNAKDELHHVSDLSRAEQLTVREKYNLL